MYYPDFKEFVKLAAKGNVIPVYKEINADLDTPVSTFLKIQKDDYAFLLESVEGQEKIARYSFLGSRPALVFKSKGKRIEIERLHEKKKVSYTCEVSPLEEIRKLIKDFKPVEVRGLPRFYGGLLGYMGYDMVRFFEEIPDRNPDHAPLPDAVFVLTDTLLVFDHVNHTIKIVTNVMLPGGRKKLSVGAKKKLYAKALRTIERLHSQLNRPVAYKKQGQKRRKARPLPVKSNFTKREFCAIVRRAKEYIRQGDIIQVVTSQRFQAPVQKPVFDIYRALRSINPSPYMFFLKFKEATLIGASPEMLVRCENGSVVTMPIAGTRPRGDSEEKDALLARELAADTKEKAEHLMLVDLGRNDLGRVCKAGRVRVGDFMRIEKYSHVMHLVSEVKGVLQPRFDCFDVLRACFPAGTLSGSPKIRAMEIIDELENTRRGPYAGCVGYFSFSQNMDTCITIRTIVVKDKTAYVQAGAGIVADSVPEREYQETVNKAKALIEALTS